MENEQPNPEETNATPEASTPAPSSGSEQQGVGPVVGIVIIIAIIIIGGAYFWTQRLAEAPRPEGAPVTETEAPEQSETSTSDEATLSDSDEIDAIEQDLENTDLEALDQELNDIENELNALEL